jgi:hypothetical protein
MLRDLGNGGRPRWVGLATMDAGARSLVEFLLGASATTPGQLKKLGTHAPKIYRLNVQGESTAVAIETLANGPLSLALADSDESLKWALAPSPAQPAAPSRDSLPLAELFFDGAQWIKLSAALGLDASTQKGLERAGLSKSVADLRVDGDLFRLTIHASLTQ